MKELENIYRHESRYLIDYTNLFLEFILKYLEIDTKIVFASNLNIVSKKLDYVCELTDKLHGRTFVFGALGKNYADLFYLKQRNIQAYFQDYNHPKYRQDAKQFHRYMGIIDLLFNEKKEDIKDIIMSENIKKGDLKRLTDA